MKNFYTIFLLNLTFSLDRYALVLLPNKLMRWSVQKRIVLFFGILAVMLLIIGFITYWGVFNFTEDAKLVTQTQAIQTTLESTLSDLKDAETGQRGFLLTGNEAYLEPYQNALNELPQSLEQLRRFFADKPTQLAKLEKLSGLINAKLSELKETVDLGRSQNLTAALQIVNTGLGKQTMDNVRGLVQEMKNTENTTLQQRLDQQNSSNQVTLVSITLLIVLNFIFFGVVYRQVNRDIYTRKIIEAQIRSFNSQLETQVEERTAEIKANYQKLEELDYLKDTFMAIASHELRNPLTSIKGYAQMLQRALLNQAKTVPEGQISAQDKLLRQVDTILHQSDRMNNLVKQLLDFSKVQNHKLEMHFSKGANLVALVDRVVEQQRLNTETRRLVVQAHPDAILATFDETQIEQVLDNLISNAIKYSPAETTITVGMEHSSENVVAAEAIVWVQDEGFGISEKHQQHIFDQFYRERTNENVKAEGLGLGLYISAEIIKQHGGRMWLESEVGKGSTFYFSLLLEPALINPK